MRLVLRYAAPHNVVSRLGEISEARFHRTASSVLPCARVPNHYTRQYRAFGLCRELHQESSNQDNGEQEVSQFKDTCE